MSPTRFPFWLASVLVLLASALAGWLAWTTTLDRLLDETARRGDNVLQLAVSALAGQLDRYERLPSLIAEQTVIRQLAADPENPVLRAQVNGYLERIQGQLGASDIYLMDARGETVAASNHATPTSFVGGNFAFRPYFSDAIKGGLGRFYALGTTSGKRGYYFGAPVHVGETIAGVLVFKIDLDAIEETWRGGDYAVLVADPDGVIFLSSRPDWLFQALAPLGEDALARITETRRYAERVVIPADVTEDRVYLGQHVLRLAGVEFLQRDLPMPEAEWQVHVLIETAPARQGALNLAAVAMLSVGLLSLLAGILWQRRLRMSERLSIQAQARAELERRVAERTAELRQAQADLVQAGKLAALGQMSAALSHEFNQPLAAARNFADNAGVLMDRGRMEEARGNIDRILGLIDRMSSISSHLRSFARKPGQKLSAVDLSEVIDASRAIAELRIAAAQAVLVMHLPEDLPPVVAGPVRLQQVLVNLLTNAADAVEGRATRRIDLCAEVEGDMVVIRIDDSGEGVPEAVRDRIFDPFFSTKGVGRGLGLGLSISYNIVKDFGGDIEVTDAPGGGARFTLRLRQGVEAAAVSRAAE
ncbi:sensor histidine kinase [Fuscovulum ytuae]|uniref:histidine kinase n=1 Tax=Fuscovulum ytuae TaxID=3042299 RepID=A0ABY8QDS8_9RHOB|nr:ATP-binding protein [Fuscovulum sp. YMD61]WGV18405.1 ATP-binding protein [Fuscovulum sp. YMD61]